MPRLETLPDMARSASVARVAAVAGQRLDPELYVKSDSEFLRPAEVDHLVGDATKAREQVLAAAGLVQGARRADGRSGPGTTLERRHPGRDRMSALRVETALRRQYVKLCDIRDFDDPDVRARIDDIVPGLEPQRASAPQELGVRDADALPRGLGAPSRGRADSLRRRGARDRAVLARESGSQGRGDRHLRRRKLQRGRGRSNDARRTPRRSRPIPIASRTSKCGTWTPSSSSSRTTRSTRSSRCRRSSTSASWADIRRSARRWAACFGPGAARSSRPSASSGAARSAASVQEAVQQSHRRPYVRGDARLHAGDPHPRDRRTKRASARTAARHDTLGRDDRERNRAGWRGAGDTSTPALLTRMSSCGRSAHSDQ